MVIVYDLDTKKKPEETQTEYLYRMCIVRTDNKLTWKQLAELVNKELGVQHSESYYRKNFKEGAWCPIKEFTTTTSCAPDDVYDYAESVEDPILTLRKERIKLTDERTQNQAYVRKMAREETLKEIAHDFASQMGNKPLLGIGRYAEVAKVKDKEGILLLSDWHYGMTCNNPWNKFDPDICRNRLSKLINKVIAIVKKDEIRKVTVLNLSDLIAGRIHSQIRIESRFDVITQTMQVAEILAEFLSCLSDYCEIDYYDCLDNHSRLEPNKSESLDLESLVRIIPWYLKERLAHNEVIHIYDNEFGMDIITCQVMGHDVIGVHGDNDRPATALDKLTLMTHRHYDLLCTAHLHHFNCDEKNQTMIVSNGSLMGTDSYAEKLRLSSDPSQTFITVSKENVTECIYRIILE